MKNKEKLKPCKYCRSKNVMILSNDAKNLFKINCLDCDILTGLFITEKEAIEFWNKQPDYKKMWEMLRKRVEWLRTEAISLPDPDKNANKYTVILQTIKEIENQESRE